MRGMLSSLHRAKLVESPSGPRSSTPGRLGIFDFEGAGEGSICLFVPNDPEAFRGRMKLRLGPGNAQMEGDLLRFTMKGDAGSYSWQLIDDISEPQEMQDFLDYAESNDRIIRHLLEGARLLQG